MRLVTATFALIALLPASAFAAAPVAYTSATCSDYSNQAAAQRAGDTRDTDGDGVYCESLPCPCLEPGQSPAPAPKPGCVKTRRTANITFSSTKYPAIYAHFRRALRRGYPRVLVLNRPGAGLRRDRLLAGFPTRRGFDRDEYPPAIGRRRVKADVAYVPASENRSHGSAMGIKLRRYCNGQRFRYVFY